MARLSPFVSFGLVMAFLAWLWPFWPVFGLSDTLYYLTICEKDVICVHRAGRSTLSDQLTILRMFISQITYSEDSIHKRRNCNLKLKSSFTKVKRIIPGKITQLVLAIQYRHKKRCTNCQDHEEMKPLLKQKLKD